MFHVKFIIPIKLFQTLRDLTNVTCIYSLLLYFFCQIVYRSDQSLMTKVYLNVKLFKNKG